MMTHGDAGFYWVKRYDEAQQRIAALEDANRALCAQLEAATAELHCIREGRPEKITLDKPDEL